jgi:hypothetical protein
MTTPAPRAAALLMAAALTGCASTAGTPSAPSSGGIVYQEHKHLQKVWVAPGFDFKGYDVLYVADIATEVPKVNPDGVESLEWSRGVVQTQLVRAIQAKGFFRTVATRATDVPAGAKVLKLDNTIVEYERGGGAARYFAGLYGAGQPVIRVRGRMADGDRALFAYEARRSGDSGSARWLGGFRSNRDIQEEDIKDLADDLADFIVGTAQGGPTK